MISAVSSVCGLFWFVYRYLLWQDLREELKFARDENERLRGIVAKQLQLYVVMDDRIRLLEDEIIHRSADESFGRLKLALDAWEPISN